MRQLKTHNGDDMESSDAAEPSSKRKKPTAFLCHATEDKELARRIAQDFMAWGIDTFFDEWEIRAGDSVRQKIDNGLGRCSHFVVLLTPVSMRKPWVNVEMDAAFVRRLEGACRFIPLRYGIAPADLPLLLRGFLSPSLDNYERDIEQLISDIHDVSRKPTLGTPPPVIVAHRYGTGLSAAAEAIVRVFMDRSETHMAMDPILSPDDVRQSTGLSDDDIIDAIDELKGQRLAQIHEAIGCGRIGFDCVTPESELFVRMDKHFMPWNPEEDGLRIAADMVNNNEDGANIQQLAQQYGWEPRRMNPAVAFLANLKLVEISDNCGTHPWINSWIWATPATRRFVRGRSDAGR